MWVGVSERERARERERDGRELEDNECGKGIDFRRKDKVGLKKDRTN